MSNKIEQNNGFEKDIMAKIQDGQIRMKPKWFFVLGSLSAVVGLIASIISSVFLINLIIFLLRKKGPGIGKLNLMFDTFPWWIPFVAIAGVILGIFILRRYDFSYKKNFVLVIFGFIVAVIIASLVIDYLGINDVLTKIGPINRFYRDYVEQSGGLMYQQLRRGLK